MGTNTWPGFTTCVALTRALNFPRRDSTTTHSPGEKPSRVASRGLISTYGSFGYKRRRTGDFEVRVWVCHWLDEPRPLSRTNGNSRLVTSGVGRGASNTKRALP